MSEPLRYLALGDSYTIGESLPLTDNFPNQLASLLRKRQIDVETPRIIAKTGWTTDELSQAIDEAERVEPIGDDYHLVTLLIGVNNQYRGRDVENYAVEFEQLLQRAIGFASGKIERVVVLSIPDWGVTPFASGRDRTEIAGAIDQYNLINRTISERYHIYYIDITEGTREASSVPDLLASDNLHPSAKEYARWSERLAAFVESRIR